MKIKAKFKAHMWYWWCGKDTGGKCKTWRAHKPKGCMGGSVPGAKREESNSKENDSNKKNKLSKNLKVVKAYVTSI